MSTDDRIERIRYLAQRIWESEGRPEGQSQRHWTMASRLVEAEQQGLAQGEHERPSESTGD